MLCCGQFRVPRTSVWIGHCPDQYASQPALEQVRQQKLDILGLGKSEGTPAEGITAEAVVVTSWQDLWDKRDSVEGKIVV